MGKQTGIIFRGTADGVIYYERLGIGLMRSMPKPFKRTGIAEAKSITLGTSSTTGKALRDALRPAIVKTPTKDMERRLVGTLKKWLDPYIGKTIQPAKSIPSIKNFNFNPATAISKHWQVPLQVATGKSKGLQLKIPAFTPTLQLKAPAYTKQVIVTVSAACCNLVSNIATDSFTAELTIPYTADGLPAHTIPLPIHMPAGSLVAVAIKITYMATKKGQLAPSPKVAFMPSGMLAAMYV